MTRDEYLRDNPIEVVCQSRGIKLIGSGNERKARCPLHNDKNPSMSVNVRKGAWTCYAGCGGGSVIDLLCKLDNLSVRDFFKREGIGKNGDEKPALFRKRTVEPVKDRKSLFERQQPDPDSKIEAIYSYEDALGRELYQVVRFKPKDFRQRHREDGEWVWNMQNCERVLYHLPEVLQSPSVVITEGEKDVYSLLSLGFMATTNVGGAGKWLDSYSETLTGKDVVICGDNDKDHPDGSNPGRDHVRKVFDSVAGKAKTVKIVTLPKHVKDISDFITSFKDKQSAKKAFEDLRDAAHSFVQGIELPIYSVVELHPRLIRHFEHFEENAFYLSKWLPGLNAVGPLIPGDMVVLIGDTGSGKTGLASGIALSALPLPTLFFELELSVERLLTRVISTRTKCTREEIRKSYLNKIPLTDKELNHHFSGLHICDKSKITVEEAERIITRSELKIGDRPRVVVLDYIQLLQGRGERYERMSDAMERLRVVAKATQTILVLVSQVHRPQKGEKEISKYSGKDSGSIESSASVLLGAWRDENDKTLMHVKILKNNEGESGREILCNFDGERMIITERAIVSETVKSAIKSPKQKPMDDDSKPYKED